jgi:Protein of unknown function (DUF1488)
VEWSFFVTEEALKRLQPSAPRNEAGLLLAFDRNRSAIYAAAVKAFRRERKGSYELGETNF